MWLVNWKKNYWLFEIEGGRGGLCDATRFSKFGTWRRRLLRGPRPDRQREGRDPRQPGGRSDRCRSSGSCCPCRCRPTSPDAHDDESGRLQEGQHAKDGRTDGRGNVELLKSTTGNNYYRYSMWICNKFYAFLKIVGRATKKCAVIWVSWR